MLPFYSRNEKVQIPIPPRSLIIVHLLGSNVLSLTMDDDNDE
jgi:hypothetical protein